MFKVIDISMLMTTDHASVIHYLLITVPLLVIIDNVMVLIVLMPVTS